MCMATMAAAAFDAAVGHETVCRAEVHRLREQLTAAERELAAATAYRQGLGKLVPKKLAPAKKLGSACEVCGKACARPGDSLCSSACQDVDTERSIASGVISATPTVPTACELGVEQVPDHQVPECKTEGWLS